jgi:DNA-binding GntR family transcriptional regulator
MNDLLLPNLARANLSDETYHILKKRIFSRRFVPGQRLDLNAIEQQLGISRTPLKMAMNRLASEGLVEIAPRRGTYVTTPTPEGIEEAFSVRRVLETLAVTKSIELMTDVQVAQLASIVQEMIRITSVPDTASIYHEYAQLDHDFHALIVRTAANSVLFKLWDQVHIHVQIARIRYRRGDRSLNLTIKEHGQIVQAFQKRDVDVARTVMGDHIHNAQIALLIDLQNLADA